MKKIFSLFLLTSFSLTSPVFSQTEAEESFPSQIEETESQEIVFSSDTLSAQTSQTGFLHENDGKKHWFTAIGGMLFFNVGLATYNRFIINAEWAKVGPNEWSRFWEREWGYDNDWYWTNFVLHPYQGSLYYMMSRASNLNRAESFGVTVLGSAFWEYLCETNAPSKNDMVYTTVGAFAVGEMLYRLSLNADEISEIFGTFINPGRWWTQSWLRQRPLGSRHNIHELHLKFAIGSSNSYTNILGGRNFNYVHSENFPFFVNPFFGVVYNDPYGHDSNEPYSQFELDISAALGKGSGIGAETLYSDLDKNLMYEIRIMSNGMLFSRAPKFSENTDTSLGAVLEYQFDWHQFYELSALGPGVAIKQRVRFEDSKLEWQAHLAWDILGTTDYYYYHRPVVISSGDTPRSYSMVSGAMTLAKLRYAMPNDFIVNFGLRGYALYDFESQIPSGSPYSSTGWELIGIMEASIELPVSKIIRLGFADEMYLKRTFYKDMPDIFQLFNTVNAFVRFQLK